MSAQSPQVAKVSGVDSSPSSAESSFRQIDDVFLQTQTRIWLGEVLQTRLSEQISVADLLADGELMFQVSREIRKMMLEKHMELKYTKAFEYEPFTSRNSGRYMPYSNVDSFLKICKILGMAGIDLFSPSDVVEKRDIRKVCMCIRALSKKARSRHFNVPDFDIVTYTIAMPTDMVGYIRSSWEFSHYNCFRSSSLSPDIEFRARTREKHLDAIAGGCNFHHEESDEAEREFSLQSDSSVTICSYSPVSQLSSDSINSPGESSVVRSNLFGQWSEQLELEVQDQIQDECIQCQQEAECLNKLTGSCFSHHSEYDHEQDNMPSSSSLDSTITLGSLDFCAEGISRNSHKSTQPDHIYVDSSMEDGASVVGNSVECNALESNITDESFTKSDVISHEICAGDCVLINGKDGIFDECVASGSFCSEGPKTPDNKLISQYIDGDNFEVSFTASVNSMNMAIRNFDFVDHSVAENALKDVCFADSANSKSDAMDEKCKEGSKSEDLVKYATPGKRLTANNKEESLFDMKGMDIGLSTSIQCLNNYTAGYFDHPYSCDNNMHMSQMNSSVADEGKELFPGQSCFVIEFPQWDQKGKCQIAVAPNSNGGCGASSASLSPVDSNMENLQLLQIARGGALWLESMEPIIADDDMKVSRTTMVKLDPDNGKQPNRFLSSSLYNDITNRTHEDSNASCNAAVQHENANEDAGRNEKLQMSTVDNKDGNGNPISGIAECRPQKRSLLKAAVKGTAVVGAMFLLLHFRRNGRGKSRE